MAASISRSPSLMAAATAIFIASLAYLLIAHLVSIKRRTNKRRGRKEIRFGMFVLVLLGRIILHFNCRLLIGHNSQATLIFLYDP